MSWPGHDDAPHFEVGWLFNSPWLRSARARVGRVLGFKMAVRLAQALIALLFFALLVLLVIFRSDVKASLSKSLERMARSAEAQGKFMPDTVHLIATKISQRTAER
jgi:hypothetical protein